MKTVGSDLLAYVSRAKRTNAKKKSDGHARISTAIDTSLKSVLEVVCSRYEHGTKEKKKEKSRKHSTGTLLRGKEGRCAAGTGL